MTLDIDSFTTELDSVLDKMEVEGSDAAGVKDATLSEDTNVASEDVKSDSDITEESTDSEEEVEAKKILGDVDVDVDAGESKDAETGTDDKTPVQFNDTVLARAVACGITLSEARSFPDNKTLGRFVDSVEQNLIHEVAPHEETAKKDDKVDLFAGLPELNPDDYSPEVIKTLDHFKEVLIKQQEQLQSYEARTDYAQESMQDAGQKEMVGWFDRAIEGLGDDYKETLGEGGFGLLPETSQEFGNRDDIAGHMALMHDGYVAQGREPPSREELFTAAVNAVLPDVRSNVQQRKLEGELEQQASQHIQRVGGGRNKSAKSPEEETAALLNDKFSLSR